MSNTDYRKQLKELMTRKGIKSHTLGKRAGITPATIYNYLNRKSEITAGNLAKVMNVLNEMPDKSLENKGLK